MQSFLKSGADNPLMMENKHVCKVIILDAKS